MVIKNFHKIAEFIPLEKHNDLDRAANLHLRHSNIEFKITGVQAPMVLIKTAQGKHMSGNYADQKTLISRTKELFSQYLPEMDIHVHAFPYMPAIVDIVSPQWLAEKMLTTGVKVKDIQTDTGIDKSNISAWLNGLRPMSQIVKAMFYFYFTR